MGSAVLCSWILFKVLLFMVATCSWKSFFLRAISLAWASSNSWGRPEPRMSIDSASLTAGQEISASTAIDLSGCHHRRSVSGAGASLQACPTKTTQGAMLWSWDFIYDTTVRGGKIKRPTRSSMSSPVSATRCVNVITRVERMD